MSADRFDLIVIGAGPGGYVAAIRAAQHGLKVACVEKRATLGGTCLNVGCIPSKSLLHATHLYQQARGGHLARFGIRVPEVGLDLDAMRAEKDKAVAELTGGIQGLFVRNKVRHVHGTARLMGTGRVVVALVAGGEQVLEATDILIATGSDVTPLPGLVPDGDRIITSTGALELVSIPEHLVVLGAGFIGLEMGSIYKRLGSAVTVLEMADRIAPGLDAELAQAAQRLLSRQGLKIITETKLLSADKPAAGGLVLEVAPVAGGPSARIQADRLLLAAGRRPYTAGLGLEAVGITPDARGRIPVDHDFRTKVPGLWAIGDVVEGPMLAHKAEEEGIACADTIAGRTGFIDHALIPSVMYTEPEVASVGRSEEELKAAGVAYKVGKFPFAANSRAKANRETDGFVKLLAAREDGRVLGVHIIGAMAGTMIAQATQAMAFGANAEDIALTCHAHPTHAEALKEAAMAAFGKPIHL
ncbi:dihydrolipoyl dehydrogenase [Niveispirillum sp. KHB5.9]|uniref:dihydrolipoyl dehydrogenase n=1 Tax=Niveispirillum sp. KHB5.9 TaxID=3400269 RepID=UPI003A897DF3